MGNTGRNQVMLSFAFFLPQLDRNQTAFTYAVTVIVFVHLIHLFYNMLYWILPLGPLVPICLRNMKRR